MIKYQPGQGGKRWKVSLPTPRLVLYFIMNLSGTLKFTCIRFCTWSLSVRTFSVTQFLKSLHIYIYFFFHCDLHLNPSLTNPCSVRKLNWDRGKIWLECLRFILRRNGVGVLTWLSFKSSSSVCPLKMSAYLSPNSEKWFEGNFSLTTQGESLTGCVTARGKRPPDSRAPAGRWLAQETWELSSKLRPFAPCKSYCRLQGRSGEIPPKCHIFHPAAKC